MNENQNRQRELLALQSEMNLGPTAGVASFGSSTSDGGGPSLMSCDGCGTQRRPGEFVRSLDGSGMRCRETLDCTEAVVRELRARGKEPVCERCRRSFDAEHLLVSAFTNGLICLDRSDCAQTMEKLAGEV